MSTTTAPQRPQWRDVPSAELDAAPDPWLQWASRRRGDEPLQHRLCEGERPAAAGPQAGWQIPSVYPAGCAFFTAHRANRQALPPPVPGARRSVLSSGTLALAGAAQPPRQTPHADGPPASRTALAAGTPVLGIIDADIALLHPMFRAANGRARIRHFWDQGQGPLRAPWRTPPELGYGRELDGAVIESLGPLPDAKAQARAYRSLGLPTPRWGHGTQVLALAGASADPLTGQADAAGTLEIVAVQVPGPAFAQTHGNWLNSCVLDGLRYLLARTAPESPLIVTLSLGAHSGSHDGQGLLERAIDALIDEQQGRLTVVIAAGNSQLARAHAEFVLPPAQGGTASEQSLWISMPYDDPSPNFAEFWIDGLDAADNSALEIEFGPEGGPTTRLRSADAPAARLLQTQAGATPQAQLQLGAADRPAGASPRLHAWLGIGARKATRQGEDGGCLWGRWRITLRNHGQRPLQIGAWVARDDLPDLGRQPARLAKSFAEPTPAALIAATGTQSTLASCRQAIVVGAYQYEPQLQRYTLWPHSAGGGADGRGPDVCGPGALRRGTLQDWLGPVSFLSTEALAPAIDPCEPARAGTSLAAPVLSRRLALLVHERGAAMPRSNLLAALAQRWPAAPIPDALPPGRAGRYWLPMPAHAAPPHP